MSDQFTSDRQKEIAENKILIYGKGTKTTPMCGFTAKVIAMFQQLNKPFEVINILDNPELRSRMKEFSGWPTFPQVYVNGEFVGGCDITTELFESGELETLVETAFNQ